MHAPGIIRQMQREDVDAVMLLAADEPTAPHWPPFEYLRMLKVIAEEPERRGAWVVGLAELSGFAIASHAAGVCELEAVVIAPSARRHGLGTLLVRAVLGWAQERGAARVQLEVRPSNQGALCLYGRLGFVVDGRRNAYYHNPAEDAVLMGLELASNLGMVDVNL